MPCRTPHMAREETVSADGPGPSPSVQQPVHGISQIRLRSSRARSLRPRIERSRTTSGASPGRHRQLAPLPAPRPGRGELSRHQRRQRPQRQHRDSPLSGDRLQPHAARLQQHAHHQEQRRHAEAAAEEADTGRSDPAPAGGAAKAVAPRVLSQLGRQTVRLAWVGRAMKMPAAASASSRSAGLGLGRVNLLQEAPDPDNWRTWNR